LDLGLVLGFDSGFMDRSEIYPKRFEEMKYIQRACYG
jgi:hypothetical protein